MTRNARSARGRYGKGSIEQRRGKWYVRHSGMIDDGQRRQWRDGPFPTRELAEAYRDRGERLSASAATDVGDYLQAWIVTAQAQAIEEQRESTADKWAEHIKLHLEPNLRGIRLGDLKPSDLTKLWRKLIMQDGKSVKTVKNIRSTLSKALRAADEDNIIPRNPVPISTLPPEHRGSTGLTEDEDEDPLPAGLINVISAREYRELVDILRASDSPFAPVAILIGETGMRRGESLAIRRPQRTTPRDTLRIRRQVINLKGGGLAIRPVKTKAGNRDIFLTPLAMEILAETERRNAATGIGSMERLMFHQRGKPLNPETFTTWWREEIRPAVPWLPPEFTLHTLRHTHASILLDNGAPESAVSARLGHQNAVITRSLYVHSGKDANQEAARNWVSAVWTP